MHRGFDAQAVEQHRGVGFRRVAAFFAHDTFELTQAHAILISELVVRLSVQGVAFFDCPPEWRIAHNDGVDDAKPIEGELVLAQHTEFLRARDRPFDRFQVTRQNSHQRRFSGAVRTRDGITPPLKKGAGDVFKQNSGAEAHGDVLNGKQGSSYDSVRAYSACSESQPCPFSRWQCSWVHIRIVPTQGAPFSIGNLAFIALRVLQP